MEISQGTQNRFRRRSCHMGKVHRRRAQLRLPHNKTPQTSSRDEFAAFHFCVSYSAAGVSAASGACSGVTARFSRRRAALPWRPRK